MLCHVLELTAEQAKTLANALEIYLSDLRMEIADTDNKDFRECLKTQKSVLTEILDTIRIPA